MDVCTRLGVGGAGSRSYAAAAATTVPAPQRTQTAEELAQAREIVERQKFLGVSAPVSSGPPDIQTYVRRLQEMVPGLDDHKATMLLSENDFNVDITAEQLLEGAQQASDWNDVKSRKQRVRSASRLVVCVRRTRH